MKVILYENNQTQGLYPITLTRPSFDIFCGGLTLQQLIIKEFNQAGIGYLVRDFLSEIVKEKFQETKDGNDFILYLDGSLVPSVSAVQILKNLVSENKEMVLINQDKIIGALINSNNFKDLKQSEVVDFISNLKIEKKEINWQNFQYCWETVVYNQQIIHDNLDYLKKDYQEIKPNVFVGQNVEMAENVCFNTGTGVIIIGDNTKILPFVYLAGPLFIGQNCLIKEFATIKDKCSIGAVCKLGGEIESTIIQGYSNKQHYGFLGHSYIGQWVNIAAGTSNSDLKNTYSQVKINGIETGQQFLGTVIGDYSKTAINTSIFTGRIIGACSFVYGTITKDIISFTNYAAHLGCVIELDLPVAINSQKAMFARRKVLQTAVDIEILKQVFEITAQARKDLNITPGKLEFKI